MGEQARRGYGWATAGLFWPDSPGQNVSGNSILNNMLVNNNSTLLSSLNVSRYTTLNNTTNLNGLLYVSGTNILQTVNNSTMNLNDINNFIYNYVSDNF
jgi:hypothetical protein